MINGMEEKVKDGSIRATTALKRHIFDIISALIVVVLVVASLDAFGLRKITKDTIGMIVAEWLPFLFAAYLLDCNLREKGKFIGKSTDNYKNIIQAYSGIVVGLTGDQVKELSDFCIYKNEYVLRNKQTAILKKEGIPIEWFEHKHTELIDDEEVTFKPLKSTSKHILNKRFTEEQVSAIHKAKHVSIVGHKVNLLLGNYNVDDETDLGPTELELEKRRKTWSLLGYVVSTFIMTIIAIKDILTWGWAGIIIVVFKTAFTFVKAYMSYFQGYNDVTIIISNHITRKTDVLKEYLDWYDKKHAPKIIEVLDGNILENS